MIRNVRPADVALLLLCRCARFGLEPAMRRVYAVSATTMLLLGWLALAQAPDRNFAPGDPLSPAEEAKGFHLPPGFEMQLVASEPDIHKPLNLAFDDRGRLWVSETVEYPFAAKENPRDAVKILDDF